MTNAANGRTLATDPHVNAAARASLAESLLHGWSELLEYSRIVDLSLGQPGTLNDFSRMTAAVSELVRSTQALSALDAHAAERDGRAASIRAAAALNVASAAMLAWNFGLTVDGGPDLDLIAVAHPPRDPSALIRRILLLITSRT